MDMEIARVDLNYSIKFTDHHFQRITCFLSRENRLPPVGKYREYFPARFL